MPEHFETGVQPVPSEAVVAIARSRRADYGQLETALDAPELPSQKILTVAGQAVRELFRIWGLDTDNFGSTHWNPLGAWVRPGSTVVLKPNWVLHYNKSGRGMDCLVTNTSLIEVVLDYVVLARPGRIIIGDAPIQGCDFNRLQTVCGMNRLLERYAGAESSLQIMDFRRTVLHGDNLGAKRSENRFQVADYVLFDLGEKSLLEALATDSERFRVTMYDPDRLKATHSPGQHQYLIAKPVIDADVVFNLPKLKCHKKAGVTGALKNLVGINGNKEFLPHHRKGGADRGGDCYEGDSKLKRLAENLLDAANRSRNRSWQSMLHLAAQKSARCAQRLGHDDNLEGAWYGNDTVWRMCLDLQRILRYGKADGTLAPEPQRRVISVTDAVIAGENDGPLAPTPVSSGLVTGATNTAAAEWVHTRLMGFDPRRIPLVQHAFDNFEWPLTAFDQEEVRVLTQDGEISEDELKPALPLAFHPPAGWVGHCELS